MKHEFRMTLEKQTKSKAVYRNPDSPIDTVYVDKDALRAEGVKGYPETITLTIEF